jgi:hypothetical protein
MRTLLKNLAAALLLLCCTFAEIYLTHGRGRVLGTQYVTAWCIWLGGPVVFGLVNSEAFQGVEMQLRFALVVFLAALLTALLYVTCNPLLYGFAVRLQSGP